MSNLTPSWNGQANQLAFQTRVGSTACAAFSGQWNGLTANPHFKCGFAFSAAATTGGLCHE